MKKFKRITMEIPLIIKFFTALLIMNVFVYSVMKKECYRWSMLMAYIVLTVKPIHVLLFMHYTLNN